MTSATVSQGRTFDLPHALRNAQQAIHLPEIQDMLRRLSEFKLGIFMPHMHDEHTGEFLPLADEVTQVESGLEVSFRSTLGIANQSECFLPVAWCWRAGASTVASVCEMVSAETPGDTEGYTKHKMLKAS